MKSASVHTIWLMIFLVSFHPDTVNSLVIPVEPSPCSDANSNLVEALHMLNDIKTNVTLELENGIHCINTTLDILQGLTNVAITGRGQGNTSITCVPYTGLVLFNVTDLTISDLVIDGCGVDNDQIDRLEKAASEIIDLFFHVSKNSTNNISMICAHCVDFVLSKMSIINTKGLGFYGINLIGDSKMYRVNISYNFPEGCFYVSRDLKEEHIGGGAILVYIDYYNNTLYGPDDIVPMTISASTFSYNSYCTGLYQLQYFADFIDNAETEIILNGGGGLSLKLAPLLYQVNFTVENSIFKNNTAVSGSGSNIMVYSGVYNSNINFNGCTFRDNGLAGDIVEEYVYSSSSAGVNIVTDISHPRLKLGACYYGTLIPSNIYFFQCMFIRNRAFSAGGVGIISLYAPEQRRVFPHYIVFEETLFSANYAFTASSLYVLEWKYIAAQRGLNVILKNSDIIRNENFQIQVVASQSITTGTVYAIATNLTLTGHTRIFSNLATGVQLDRGILHVDGEALFHNNSGVLGGGIRLEPSSLIIISNNSVLDLVSNRASVSGGAIYSQVSNAAGVLRVTDCPLYFGELNLLCFQNFAENCINLTRLNVTVRFEDNFAHTGSMVFGTTLNDCPWSQSFLRQNESLGTFEHLWNRQQLNQTTPLIFDRAPNSTEQVATPTFELSLMNPNDSDITAVPGKPFYVRAHTLDAFGRPSYSVISSIAKFDGMVNYEDYSTVGETNYWLLGSNSTTNIPIKVTGTPDSDRDHFTMVLLSIGSSAQLPIRVSLMDCPPGFVYENVTRICECDPRFKAITEAHFECNSDFTIQVQSNHWIGVAEDNETLIFVECHQDYCRRGQKTVNIDSLDEQCSTGHNRTGIGCGSCREGYSLAFGSNKCIECSNKNLLSLIFYFFMGILIIVIMLGFKVTISHGYLNGLLFYSNIISLFVPVLFGSVSNEATATLLIVFSWINLDIGLEWCFYDGMTNFQRSALSFAFPLYLYVLLGIIVLLAKRSSKFAARLTKGDYSYMKMFATLFVMTYSNIMRNCMEVLGLRSVYNLDQNPAYISWITDPGKVYLNHEHIPLWILSLSIFVFYLVPAPLILMFPKYSLRIPVVRKYKPLYDAFWAPFKPNFRFWIGFRLMLRFIPFLLANVASTPANVLVLVIFLLILVFMQSVFQPFQGALRNAIDMFLLLDLTALLIGYLYFYGDQFSNLEYTLKQQIPYHKEVLIYFIFNVSLVYALMYCFIIANILMRFPILQHLICMFLKKIVCCKGAKKWVPKSPLLSESDKHSTIEEETVSKLSISDIRNIDQEVEQSTKAESEIPPHVTFSELREPLLEDAGSVEVHHVYHTIN